MFSANPLDWWGRFLALPNAHPVKTIGVAFLVALVCSLAVSFTAVFLKPLQEANRLRASAAGLMTVLDDLGAGPPDFRTKTRFIKVPSGEYTQAGAPAMAVPGQVQAVATVYEVYDDGRLKLVVLPVSGPGYKSTLKAYLALRADLNTIAALSFYEQDETPGMGARIGEKSWQVLWAGKKVADDSGAIRIQAVKGKGSGPYEVDGISGATRTIVGVTKLVRFWLGPDGYGPYLQRLKAEAPGSGEAKP